MSEDIEVKARDMGWAPKDEFRGKPELWVDAETYVERGEHVLPIVKAEKKRLEGEVQTLKGEVSTLQQLVKAGQESIEEFKKYHDEDSKRRVETAVAKLKAEMKQAREEGDIDREMEASDALAELRAAPPAKTNGEAKPDFTKQPWFQGWLQDNAWYGVDKEKTAYAQGQAVFLNMSGSPLRERAYLDEIAKLVQDKYPDINPRREAAGKVEGARSGSSQSSSDRSYQDLPADVKTTCDKWGDKLVGPGKSFKTLADWRKKYAADYFAE
jgi:hypothetical protein